LPDVDASHPRSGLRLDHDLPRPGELTFLCPDPDRGLRTGCHVTGQHQVDLLLEPVHLSGDNG
jgi:hypothetical protein